MATRSDDIPPYLRKPLYVYDLPPELVETLTLHASTAVPFNQPKKDDDDLASQRHLNDEGVSTSAACTLCNAKFRDVSDQRQHVRSDLHRYNLKLQMKQLPSIDEATFVKKIGDLDESISGSESSESESEEERVDPSDLKLSSLLKRQAKLSHQNPHNEDDTSPRKGGPGNKPMYWLTSPKLPEKTGLGIYKAIFSTQEQGQVQASLVDVLKRKQLQPISLKHGASKQDHNPRPHDPHFFLCMIGGGHFAAAIVALAPEIRKGQGGIEERHAVVKAHKTFHRYTTRRKQGGSQSANDNAKGNAHSVGSSIRRANEAALIVDVRNLLADWKDMIDSAELIFVRATGSQNRRTLFGPYEGQVLTSKDPRLRGFPFSTRRATQNELIRAFQELTRAKVEILVDQSPEKVIDSNVGKAQAKPKTAPEKPTPEQEEALFHTSQLTNLIRRSKAPGVLLYLKKNNLSANFEFYPPDQGSNHHNSTPLHLAASHNAAAVIIALLTKADANPTVKNRDGRVAYELAGESKTRDAFRISRHTLGESAFDWSVAHVPSALTADEVDAKSRQEQEELLNAETERRRVDLERIQQEEENQKVNKIERKAGIGQSLGAVPTKTWIEKNEEDTRGLTQEMKQRLERERRARAAEARMKVMAADK